MKNADAVLYFIMIAVIILLSVIFIWFFLSEDIRSPPTDIYSIENKLYCTARNYNGIAVMTSDSTKDNFSTTWNIVFDASGTGTFTLRNSFTGNWIYFVPDSDGNSEVITVDLPDRQDADVDPIGWFLMKEGTSVGTVKFESYQTLGKYMTVTPILSDIHPYAIMTVSSTESEFKLLT